MVVVVLGWVVDVVVGCVVDVVGLVVVVVGITVVVVLGWVVDVVVGYVVVDVGIVVVVVLACVVDVVGYVVVVGFTVVVVLGWVVDVVVGQVHPVVVVGCPPPALAPVVGAPARSMIAPTERLTTPKIVRRRSVVAAAKNRATALSILRRAGAPKPDMRTFPFRSSGRAALWPPPLSSSSPLSQAHASNQESGEFHARDHARHWVQSGAFHQFPASGSAHSTNSKGGRRDEPLPSSGVIRVQIRPRIANQD